jgi:hypothetical protein
MKIEKESAKVEKAEEELEAAETKSQRIAEQYGESSEEFKTS